MKASLFSLAVLALFLGLGIHTAYGIKCYVCNSGDAYDKEDCADTTKLKNKKDTFLRDCADLEVEHGRTNGSYTLCRVLTQTVEKDHRIVRQCASEGRMDRCIERTGTKDIKLNYCHCDSDGCNAAGALYSPVTAAVISLVMATTAFALST